MAIVITDLFSSVRYGLGDTMVSNYRWTESHLIELLNEALADLTREHRLLTATESYYSGTGEASFQLTVDDIVTATAFVDTTNNTTLLFRSPADIYRDYPNYSEVALESNKPLYIFKQKNADWNEYSVYPVPVTLALEMTYHRLHSKVTSVASVIELPDMYYTALKHYVLGYAIRENNDTQNREFGVEHLRMYEEEKKKLSVYAQEGFVKKSLYTERKDRDKR